MQTATLNEKAVDQLNSLLRGELSAIETYEQALRRLNGPGTDLADLCARIRSRMPELDVYDGWTYSWMCMEYWLTRTGIGISFGMSVILVIAECTTSTR